MIDDWKICTTEELTALYGVYERMSASHPANDFNKRVLDSIGAEIVRRHPAFYLSAPSTGTVQ